MHELVEQLIAQARAAWRHRWYGVGCAWVVALAGWFAITQLPNRYEATARVYVDTQSVLRPLLAGVAVQPNVDQVINMMSRTLISRPNVERVVRMADIDTGANTPLEREQLVTRMMKGLAMKSAGGENLYTISFVDADAQQAKRVVQALLTIFVEGSLGNKRKDTESAQRFINEQLKTYNERLVASESAMTDFKRRNMHLMGDGRQNYYSRLAETQAMLNQAKLDLKEAENSRDAIRKQTEGEEMPSLLGDQAAPDASNTELDGRIRSLQEKLDGLRMMYTDRHPDVQSLTRMIAQLKQQREAEAKQRKPAAVQRGPVQNLLAQQLAVAMAEAEAAVASMKARVGEYQKRVGALQAAAAAVPQVEAEYTQLTRDYEVTKKNYDTLLARLESAQISGSMENAGVMDFRVIDPPQAPSVPSAPNRPLLMSLGLLAALGAGIAVTVVLSQIRSTFDDEERLRASSGLPVLGTVVMAWTDKQITRRRKGLMAFVLSLVSLLSAYSALMAAMMLAGARA